ncbi:MAG: hypothetical protein QOJ29_2973 [Thermoleophilaceae bacterium]|jgi:hypothetical protein|nr:hypothetical protein [Thermoleophilaceae bacterium]
MKFFRRRLKLILALTAIVAVVVPAAFAFAADDPQATASVVKIEHHKAPRTKVVHRKFRPWSKPSAGQVREIIANESRRWGVPAASLSRRVACESHYHWWAQNGQFAGVLQFSPGTFYRGLHTIRSHNVKIVRQKTRRVHDARVTHYSDGRKVRRRTTPRRQRLIVVYSARIPRRPSVNNTFAQIRIGAQALRGISAVHSSEWSCGA